ncbi:hypothetical protein IWQ60_004210 [Tieghemiomyces parasiticus]|uniref:Uncharacterized protein n=1 Tax=Tieghemiomyces parasiticus TaxID=78921 RepID=A0A9W8AGK9_9FUNG|nr:hypothetical protein IWQ60_004210 [Tieghemiomyces parasiticus]
MPVRHFDIFTVERRLLQSSPLNILSDIRVGIDGHHWLRRLMVSVIRDPYPAAMGGVPLALEAAIEKELTALKAHRIHPLFVFSGIGLLRKDKPFSSEDQRPARRAGAWSLYDHQRTEAALSQWQSSGSTSQPDLLNDVFRILRRHGVDFMRAPYSAWGQLVYLQRHPQSPIHAIYAGSEILTFPVDKVIVSLELDKGTFAWLSKPQILRDLGLDAEQFLDVCILAGFDWSATFPPLAVSNLGFTFKAVHDLIKQHKTGFNTVQHYADNPEVIKTKYVDQFCRARCAVKYHLVLTTEGAVVPLPTAIDEAADVPSDIHEFIGYRFPDEVYQYLGRGLVGPQVLNNLVSGVLLETAPLCNGETSEYRKLLAQVLPLRTCTLSFLSKSLHQFYHNRKVVSVYFFEPTVEHAMAHAQCDTNPHLVDADAIRAFDGASVTFATCLAHLSVVRSTTATDATGTLIQTDTAVASTLLTVLAQIGVIDKQRQATAFGEALTKGYRRLSNDKRATSEDWSQELLLALLLVRYGALKASPFSTTYDTVRSDPRLVIAEPVAGHIRLIARTLSLVPGKYKKSTASDGSASTAIWTGGPLSRDLLAFNSCARVVTKTLRSLTEMIILNLFLTNHIAKPRDDYAALAQQLPYASDANVGMGILAKQYLQFRVNQLPKSPGADSEAHGTGEAAAGKSGPLAAATSAEADKYINASFGAFVDPAADLQRGFRFWDGIVEAVKSLTVGKEVSADVARAFSEADTWLRPLRN